MNVNVNMCMKAMQVCMWKNDNSDDKVELKCTVTFKRFKYPKHLD